MNSCCDEWKRRMRSAEHKNTAQNDQHRMTIAEPCREALVGVVVSVHCQQRFASVVEHFIRRAGLAKQLALAGSNSPTRTPMMTQSPLTAPQSEASIF